MSECEFCNDMEEVKELNQYRSGDFKYRYKVCLVEEMLKSNAVRSTITFRKRQFNYCPLCGRKL